MWGCTKRANTHGLCVSFLLLQISWHRTNVLSPSEKDLQCVQDILVPKDVQLTLCFPVFRYPNPSHKDSLFWILYNLTANIGVVVCVPRSRTGIAKMLESPNFPSDACALLRSHSQCNRIPKATSTLSRNTGECVYDWTMILMGWPLWSAMSRIARSRSLIGSNK